MKKKRMISIEESLDSELVSAAKAEGTTVSNYVKLAIEARLDASDEERELSEKQIEQVKLIAKAIRD